jgi:hypothetical protein
MPDRFKKRPNTKTLSHCHSGTTHTTYKDGSRASQEAACQYQEEGQGQPVRFSEACSHRTRKSVPPLEENQCT